MREKKEIALAIASSGIAATLLTGRRTAHSAFKLFLNLASTEIPTCNISRKSGKAKILRDCKLIVWDECTMSHKAAFEATVWQLRLQTTVWLGRTWGYAPHHPTQFMLKVRELEWTDVGFLLQGSFICSRIRNRLQLRCLAAKLLPWKGGGGT